MDERRVLTVKELAEYIRLHEKKAGEPDEKRDYLKFMANGQWRYELASLDHFYQKEFIDSRDEDLDLVIASGVHAAPLSNMIDETLIELDLKADTKNKALSKLAKMASLIRVASSYEELYIELESREKIQSTAVGDGVAIPHSRFPHQLIYRKPKLIIARSIVGVDFGAPDGKKVHLFFLPCAPTQFVHLRMLAQIAKLLHIPNVIERFRNTTQKNDILLIIKAFEQLNLLSNPEPEERQRALRAARKEIKD